jgi:hypothetical protein
MLRHIPLDELGDLVANLSALFHGERMSHTARTRGATAARRASENRIVWCYVVEYRNGSGDRL